MSGIEIRVASISDLPSLANCHIPEKILHNKIEAKEIFVAVRENSVVACLVLDFLWSTKPFISLIYVHPELRSKGIGRQMLDYLCELLKSEGHSTLYSSSQENEHEPQAWHRKMGFEECGMIREINEGGIGEVFFRKTLI